MGDIADMMLDGTFCNTCGMVFDDTIEGRPAPDYPRWCDDCVKHQDGQFMRDGDGAWRRTDPKTLTATVRGIAAIKMKARRGKRGRNWRKG